MDKNEKIDGALVLLYSAIVKLKEEAKKSGSRELSLVITKVEEAVMWREKDLSIKAKKEVSGD